MRPIRAFLAQANNTMKNTAPPRALRGRGYTGAEPPTTTSVLFWGGLRGGCGRHAPPPKGHLSACIRDAAAWGKPREAASEGKPMQTGPATQSGSRQKRSVATTDVPSVARAPNGGVPNGAPGSTPGAGARQGQRAQKARTACLTEKAMINRKRWIMRMWSRRTYEAPAGKKVLTKRTIIGRPAGRFATRWSVARITQCAADKKSRALASNRLEPYRAGRAQFSRARL